MEEKSSLIFKLDLLSNELLCHIFSFLPLREVLRLGMLNKKLQAAVNMHLLLCKKIDFCQGEIFGYMPPSITDKNLMSLLQKCPNLEVIYGLHPQKLERWRLRKSPALSVPGVIDALFLCGSLIQVETSHLRLLEAISLYFPHVEIIGQFRNRDGVFPPQSTQKLKLTPYLRITSLHLIGVQVPELTALPELQYLYLQWVSFTRLHPFRTFSAPKLKTFVMRHCIGPSLPLRYYSLFLSLGLAPDLNRLELVCVPFLGGMMNRTVEEVLRDHGFQKLCKIVIGDCKGMIESDIGQLMIAASQSLKSLTIQASLTKDSLFVSLHFARCDFSQVKNLHLGYIEDFPPKEEWPNDTLLGIGLVETPDVPASITDSGIKFVNQLFPNATTLTVSNCPHIIDANKWISEVPDMWDSLTCLTLERCHCLHLDDFAQFLSQLKNIEVVILKNMFREPPKGCSHVGLSAGTGLGLSSAIVSTQDEHIAVQGHQIEAVHENENGGDIDGVDLDNHEDNVNPEVVAVPEQRNPSRRRSARLSKHASNYANEEERSESDSSFRLDESESSSGNQSLQLKSSKYRHSRKMYSKTTKRSMSYLSSSSDDEKENLTVQKVVKRSRKSMSGSTASPSCSKAKSYRMRRNVKKGTERRHSLGRGTINDDLEKPSTSKGKKSGKIKSASKIKQVKHSVSSSPDCKYRGPLTRQRKQMMSSKNEVCNRSTQTVRGRIPRSLSYRAARSSSSSSSFLSSDSSNSESNCGEFDCIKCGKSSIRSTSGKKCNKATSTSDPLLEDDVFEWFQVISSTLKSLTIISCGISEIDISDCPSLAHLEVQSCRILKEVTLGYAPSLMRLNLSYCPKLITRVLISEVLCSNSEVMLVYVKPFMKATEDNKHDICTLEDEVIFGATSIQCVTVVHDFCTRSCDDDKAKYRENLLSLLTSLKEMPSCSEERALSREYSMDRGRYPWDHRIERKFGQSRDSRYELFTNNPLLGAYWVDRNFCTDLETEETNKVPPCTKSYDLIRAELVELKRTFVEFFAFYFHMCDTNSG